MLPFASGTVSIEPQYDGVIMLSAEAVLFSDAKPRPDGRKVYHVFERTLSTSTRDENLQTEEFSSTREQLLSQAREDNLQNIQQVLAENGLGNQEWSNCCESLGVGAWQTLSSDSQQHLSNSRPDPSRRSPSKQYQFEMVFPTGPSGCHKMRALLRRLRHRGVNQVELEPENRRIVVKTRRKILFAKRTGSFGADGMSHRSLG
ncbi:uncharacterized protein LOC143036417 isoform X2 [Oratosquilla oratoria]|uniref:uncharacterized protein LOC143036417 isoform X2 n=1 Tax=Oratosquilla oratoria TaxID=337810 RepID=UPI003F75E6BC